MSVNLRTSEELSILGYFGELMGVTSAQQVADYFYLHNLAAYNARYNESIAFNSVALTSLSKSITPEEVFGILEGWRINTYIESFACDSHKIYQRMYSACFTSVVGGSKDTTPNSYGFLIGQPVDFSITHSHYTGFVIGFSKGMPAKIFDGSWRELSGYKAQVAYFSASACEVCIRECDIETLKNNNDFETLSIEQAQDIQLQIHKRESKRVEEREQKALEARQHRDAFIERANEICPGDVKAVIVATHESYDNDKSDPHSDYHATKKGKTIILAFSKHTRDIFSEMRKAAKNHPDVEFMAELDKEHEHREKYSMGKGYYLAEEKGWARGWYIQKRVIYNEDNKGKDIPTGEFAPCLIQDEKNSSTKKQATIESGVTNNACGASYALNEDKNGVEISFNEKPLETVRVEMKQLGFRWHRGKKVWYAKQSESRLNFVNKLVGVVSNETTNSKEPDLNTLLGI